MSDEEWSGTDDPEDWSDLDDLNDEKGQPTDTGGSLADLLGAPLEPRLAAAILESISRQLAASHQKGVFHGALEPKRVRMKEVPGQWRPRIRITDYGAAVESAVYAAPERATGYDARSDLYSLGLIAHHIIVGALPTTAGVAPGLPAGIEPVLARMLAHTPEQRPTLAEARAAFATLSSGSWLKSWKGALAGGVLAVAVVAVWLLGRSTTPTREPVASTPLAASSNAQPASVAHSDTKPVASVVPDAKPVASVVPDAKPVATAIPNVPVALPTPIAKPTNPPDAKPAATASAVPATPVAKPAPAPATPVAPIAKPSAPPAPVAPPAAPVAKPTPPPVAKPVASIAKPAAPVTPVTKPAKPTPAPIAKPKLTTPPPAPITKPPAEPPKAKPAKPQSPTPSNKKPEDDFLDPFGAK